MIFNYRMISARNIAKSGFAIVGVSERKALIGAFTTNEDAVLYMECGFSIEETDEGMKICPKEDIAYRRDNETNDMEFPAVLISEEDFITFMLGLIDDMRAKTLENLFAVCMN